MCKNPVLCNWGYQGKIIPRDTLASFQRMNMFLEHTSVEKALRSDMQKPFSSVSTLCLLNTFRSEHLALCCGFLHAITQGYNEEKFLFEWRLSKWSMSPVRLRTDVTNLWHSNVLDFDSQKPPSACLMVRDSESGPKISGVSKVCYHALGSCSQVEPTYDQVPVLDSVWRKQSKDWRVAPDTPLYVCSWNKVF